MDRELNILVTGASGFIGSFICSEGLDRGFRVWAGMRRTSSSQYLTDERLRFAQLDLGDYERLRQQLRHYREEMGGRGWDYVVHAAGATKSLRREGFFQTNTEGTKHLVRALMAEDMVPRRFVFVSSLSIYGAIREEPVRRATEDSPWIYVPIQDTDTPMPNTAYGESKLAAEQFLAGLAGEVGLDREQGGFPYVILRPTGVYGPRERDYFLMAQSIRQHVDFAVGYRPQEITFVYVSDVVQAVYKAMDAPGAVGRGYFLSDGEVYDSRRFSDLLQQEMGRSSETGEIDSRQVPWVLHIKAPLWFLWLVCAVNGMLCRWMGRLTTLNLDKYHILSQRNWQCDIGPARRDLGYEPQVQLEEGVRRSVQWYRQEGWL
ncbi:MAG: NAD(P)-dependent oxidoreductase [Bacteroidaceae bacterium]|nr:NAD(P)-dependent oxidoreductase [Bacteroidaceae bacterium]